MCTEFKVRNTFTKDFIVVYHEGDKLYAVIPAKESKTFCLKNNKVDFLEVFVSYHRHKGASRSTWITYNKSLQDKNVELKEWGGGTEPKRKDNTNKKRRIFPIPREEGTYWYLKILNPWTIEDHKIVKKSGNVTIGHDNQGN